MSAYDSPFVDQVCNRRHAAVVARLDALEKDSHPPQSVVPADEFDVFARRWAELFESLDAQVQRPRKRIDELERATPEAPDA